MDKLKELCKLTETFVVEKFVPYFIGAMILAACTLTIVGWALWSARWVLSLLGVV